MNEIEGEIDNRIIPIEPLKKKDLSESKMKAIRSANIGRKKTALKKKVIKALPEIMGDRVEKMVEDIKIEDLFERGITENFRIIEKELQTPASKQMLTDHGKQDNVNHKQIAKSGVNEFVLTKETAERIEKEQVVDSHPGNESLKRFERTPKLEQGIVFI